MFSKIATLFTVFTVCALAQQPQVNFQVDTSSLNMVEQRMVKSAQNLVALQNQASQNISSNITDVIDNYQQRFEEFNEKVRELNRRTAELLAQMANEVRETAIDAIHNFEFSDLFDGFNQTNSTQEYVTLRRDFGWWFNHINQTNSTELLDIQRDLSQFNLTNVNITQLLNWLAHRLNFNNQTELVSLRRDLVLLNKPNVVSLYDDYEWEEYGDYSEPEYYYCNDTACYYCYEEWTREGLNYYGCEIQQSYYVQNSTGYYYCYDYGNYCEQQESYSFCNYTDCYDCSNYNDCEQETWTYCDEEGCYNCTGNNGVSCTMQESYTNCVGNTCYNCTNYTDCFVSSESYYEYSEGHCFTDQYSAEGYFLSNNLTNNGNCYYYDDWGQYYECYQYIDYYYDDQVTTDCYESWQDVDDIFDKLEDAFFHDYNVTYGPVHFQWTNPEDFFDELEDNYDDQADYLTGEWSNATAAFLFNTTDALVQLAEDLENSTLPLMADLIVQTEVAVLNFYNSDFFTVNGMSLSDVCPVFPYFNEERAYNNTFDVLSEIFLEPIYEIAEETEDEGIDFIQDGIYYNQVVEAAADDGMSAWIYGVAGLSGAAALATITSLYLRKKSDTDYERVL